MSSTRVLTVDPANPGLESVRQAASVIRGGGLVAFPTETVYGLGGNAQNPVAVANIFAAKGRPGTNPLIVHVADRAAARELAADWPDTADRLAAAFWPGALTLVVTKTDAVPPPVTGGGPTVALRCPAHPVAAALLREAGVPVAAPSANRSGQLSPTTAEHVVQGLGEAVDLILDGGPCPGGLESTVVDVTKPTVRLLRPGLITQSQLEAIVGPVDVGGDSPGDGSPLPSPGLLTRHYAPRTALECAATPDEANFLANLYETAGLKVARYTVADDPETAAANLYADLHRLDAGGFDRIIATLPPDADVWRAIRDRLTRASAEE